MSDPFCCDICFEKYTITSRVPMVARCGHTLCSMCLSHMSAPFCCPTCRVTSNDMAKNFALCTILGIHDAPNVIHENKQLEMAQRVNVNEDFEDPVTVESLGLSIVRENIGFELYHCKLFSDRIYNMAMKLEFFPRDASTLPFYVDTCVYQNDVAFTYRSLTFQITTFARHVVQIQIMLKNIDDVRVVVRCNLPGRICLTEWQCIVNPIII